MAVGGTYEQHPSPPPGPPELPEGVESFPRWPAWYGFVGLVCALVVATLAYLIVKSVAVAGGGDPNDDSPAVTLTRLVDISNANALRLNELMFAHMDYAVVGYRS